jgi:hypothetical protein
MKKIWAFTVAFFAFGFIGLSLRAIGPLVAGVFIMTLGIEPMDSQDIKTLESVGNIFNLIVSGYIAIKVFKKIAKTKE